MTDTELSFEGAFRLVDFKSRHVSDLDEFRADCLFIHNTHACTIQF